MASTEDYAPALARRVAHCATDLVSFTECVFRSTPPKYANVRDLLSGIGSGEGGGRWNPPGVRAAYLGLTIKTLLAELRLTAQRSGLKVATLLPRTLCSVEVHLHMVLDLSDGRIRQRLKYSYDDMVSEDWWAIQNAGHQARTQFLGRKAFECGYEGLIAPSAADRPHGRILIAFPDNLSRTSQLQIVNVGQLGDPAASPADS